MPGVSIVRLPDFDPCWAGPGRTSGEFCFVGMDGELRLTTPEARPVAPFERFTPLRATDLHDEAVNGVAFVGDRLAAVSTPSGILFLKFSQIDPAPARPRVEGSLLWYGSHDIVATTAGTFLAPLGRTGLLDSRFVDGRQKNSIVVPLERELDFYKVAQLPAINDEIRLACAARRGGLATFVLRDGTPGPLTTLGLPDLDVVDVAPLRVPTLPRGVVAIGRDGRLVFVRDVAGREEPIVMRPDILRGTAYRVFSVRGGIVVLTGKGLYLFPGLVDEFVSGRHATVLPASFMEFDPVDANVCGDRWLLVVLADQMLRFDLQALLGEPEAPRREFDTSATANCLKPEFTWDEIAMESNAAGEQLVVVA